jgi:hypothetical protein
MNYLRRSDGSNCETSANSATQDPAPGGQSLASAVLQLGGKRSNPELKCDQFPSILINYREKISLFFSHSQSFAINMLMAIAWAALPTVRTDRRQTSRQQSMQRPMDRLF